MEIASIHGLKISENVQQMVIMLEKNEKCNFRMKNITFKLFDFSPGIRWETYLLIFESMSRNNFCFRKRAHH